ncbi:Uncharacterised protein [Mycobacteroides abscessus subsp. abscessus]|nr:Uncharacterised protein [Mycobacteroides abscessus subsp. abscessus]
MLSQKGKIHAWPNAPTPGRKPSCAHVIADPNTDTGSHSASFGVCFTHVITSRISCTASTPRGMAR